MNLSASRTASQRIPTCCGLVFDFVNFGIGELALLNVERAVPLSIRVQTAQSFRLHRTILHWKHNIRLDGATPGQGARADRHGIL